METKTTSAHLRGCTQKTIRVSSLWKLLGKKLNPKTIKDLQLHLAVRHGAVDEGTSLRDIVQRALGEYLERVRRED